MNNNQQNWNTVKIQEICKVASGSTPRTNEPSYWNGDIPWITPMDLSKLNSKYIAQGERSITDSGLRNCSVELLQPNSLIMSSRAPIGYFAINTKQATTNQGCKTFICGDSVDVEFLYYYLTHHLDEIKRLGSGSTFAEVGKKHLENLIIQLPELTIQRKIGFILNVIDSFISKTDQIIQKTEILKQGLMQELLIKGIEHKKYKNTRIGEIPEEWNIVKLGTVVERVGSGITPRGGSSVYSKSGVPFIRSQNIHFDGIHSDDLAYISTEIHNSMSRSVVKNEDVLLNITGASIGRCTIVPSGFPEANANQHVCIIRTKNSILYPNFLNLFLQSRQGQKQIMSLQAGGNRQGLNYEQIKQFAIPLANSLFEQVKISEILESLYALISKNKEYKFSLIKLRDGLMQDIFSQKIQVN